MVERAERIKDEREARRSSRRRSYSASYYTCVSHCHCMQLSHCVYAETYSPDGGFTTAPIHLYETIHRLLLYAQFRP